MSEAQEINAQPGFYIGAGGGAIAAPKIIAFLFIERAPNIVPNFHGTTIQPSQEMVIDIRAKLGPLRDCAFPPGFNCSGETRQRNWLYN